MKNWKNLDWHIIVSVVLVFGMAGLMTYLQVAKERQRNRKREVGEKVWLTREYEIREVTWNDEFERWEYAFVPKGACPYCDTGAEELATRTCGNCGREFKCGSLRVEATAKRTH